MSFLDKILDGDVDEKALSDMQQSLQSDLFTTQQSGTPMQSYIPPPPSISTFETSAKPAFKTPDPSFGIKPEPSFTTSIKTETPFSNSIKADFGSAIKSEQGYHVLPIKPEPPTGQMLTMLQPMQQHGPSHTAQQSRPPLVLPVSNQQAILTSVPHSQQTTYTTSLEPGAISTASIVPTAVITPQRVNTPIGPQVIAVSSSVMVPMQVSGGQFAVYTAPPQTSQPPQTIMVSAAPHSAAQQQVGGVIRPNMITQPIRSMQSKPMVVPIQPLVQVKSQPIPIQSQPIPIQPAIRPQPQAIIQPAIRPQPQASNQPAIRPQPQQPKSEQKTAAILSSMSTRESVQKLKAFLTNLLNISNKQDAATGQTVKDLIGKVMTNNIDEETFLTELQVALKSPPQPHLLVFLKQSVPVLRNEMQSRQRSMGMQQGKAPPHAVSTISSHTPFPGLAPVQTSKIIPMSGPPQMGHQIPGAGGSHYHAAPTFTAPQRTFADKYKKKYTLSKDDTEINDVTSMAGVNLHEEAAKISTQDNVSQEQRSTHDVSFVQTESLSNKISRICDRHNVSSCGGDVKQLLSHALEGRMRNLVEKLVSINHHRLELHKQDDQVVATSNVKGQLKVLMQIQLEESKRRQEKEKAQILKEAKSRSKQSNLEAKAKAKQVVMEEEQMIRQREANETALAAIGARKRPKADMGDHMIPGPNPRFRSHRINIRDVIFLCENDLWLNKSELLFKLHVK